MKIHEKYMLRCLELGRKAIGSARPNPAVGACIVHQDHILGEGYTSPYGGPHAEVNALNQVKDNSALGKATLYVSLEPCSHQGKTPPCTEAIIQSGIRRVVVGIGDPNPEVNGQGIDQLKAAGCELTLGVAADECREHHRRFLTLHEKKRPYVILKWAQSADGYLAPEAQSREPGQPFWLSGPEARQRVHQWRSEEQAILVGAQTVVDDDPRLTVRHWQGENPLRIVLDRNGQVKRSHKVCDDAAPTWIYSEKSKMPSDSRLQLRTFTFSARPIEDVLEDLGKHYVSSVMVEGGANTLNGFIKAGVWDEARVFTTPTILGGGLLAPRLLNSPSTTSKLGSDTLNIYRNDPESDL